MLGWGENTHAHTHKQHMNNVAASLLVRFFSHFTLRLHGTQCDLHSYGVIMENIFPVESSCIAETYDLKGSTYKRSAASPTLSWTLHELT